MSKLKDSYYDDYNWLLKQYINDQVFFSQLFTDDDPGDLISHGIADRDSEYTELLQNYVELSRRRNKFKEFHKWAFFWIIIVLCIVFGYFVIKFIITSSQSLVDTNQFSSESLVAFISALASLVSVIISIPIIISKYLFNTKEDDNITEIIKGTQIHDSNEIKLLSEHFAKKTESKRKESANKVSKKTESNTEMTLDEIEKALKNV